MKPATIAPHLVGRMLPPLFALRFPVAMHYVMHAQDCPRGLFSAERVPAQQREARPMVQYGLFAEAAA